MNIGVVDCNLWHAHREKYVTLLYENPTSPVDSFCFLNILGHYEYEYNNISQYPIIPPLSGVYAQSEENFHPGNNALNIERVRRRPAYHNTVVPRDSMPWTRNTMELRRLQFPKHYSNRSHFPGSTFSSPFSHR